MKINQGSFEWYQIRPPPPPHQQAAQLPSSAKYALDMLQNECVDSDRLAFIALHRCGKDIPPLRRLIEMDYPVCDPAYTRHMMGSLRAEAMAELQRLVDCLPVPRALGKEARG